MSKYDLENAISDIFNLVKSNLDAKIDQIQAEKDVVLGANNFTIEKINSNAWFDRLDDRVTNYSPFMYYNINQIETVSEYGATIKTASLYFLVVISLENENKNINAKMLRYVRALEEVINENTGKIKKLTKLRVKLISPIDLRDQDTSIFHKASGVTLEFSLG